MPRYFFDIEAETCTEDEDGMELADDETAAIAALRVMLDVARLGAAGQDERQMAVVVRNEAGTEVYRTELTIRAKRLDRNRVDHSPEKVRYIT
jgi:uncharacterized protein YcbX